MKRVALVCAALFAVALGLRVALRAPLAWSGYDESVYATYTNAWGAGLDSYRDVFKSYPLKPELNAGPPPTRVAFVATAALACKLAGACDAAVIRDTSLLFGALLAALAFLLLRHWLPLPAAVSAAVLVAVSPLGLAMSERGLQDTFFAAVALLVLWAHDGYWRRPSRTAAAAVGASSFVAILTKEAALPLLAMQTIVAVVCYRNKHSGVPWWPLVAAVAVAGLCAGMVLVWVAGDAETLRATYTFYVKAVPAIPYSVTRQGGPWFRYAIDLLLLSPVVWMLAVWGAGRSAGSLLMTQTIIGFALFSGLPILNVRFVMLLDVLVRGIAVAGIYDALKVRRHAAVTVGVAVSALVLVDWWQYERIFRAGGVYDPVTFDLARALGFFVP